VPSPRKPRREFSMIDAPILWRPEYRLLSGRKTVGRGFNPRTAGMHGQLWFLVSKQAWKVRPCCLCPWHHRKRLLCSFAASSRSER
jgi:hypothetical protein